MIAPLELSSGAEGERLGLFIPYQMDLKFTLTFSPKGCFPSRKEDFEFNNNLLNLNCLDVSPNWKRS
jgi:hypothetical protein